jgi:hypothetical protein
MGDLFFAINCRRYALNHFIAKLREIGSAQGAK